MVGVFGTLGLVLFGLFSSGVPRQSPLEAILLLAPLGLVLLIAARQGAVVRAGKLHIRRPFDTKTIVCDQVAGVTVRSGPSLANTTIVFRMYDGATIKSWWGWSRSSAVAVGEFLGTEVQVAEQSDSLTGGTRIFECNPSLETTMLL